MKPVLAILAAGMGSRYGGLKQIDTVGSNGECIIDFSIYDAKEAGFEKVVLIIREEHYEAFENALGRKVRQFMEVEYAFQDMNDLPNGYTMPEGRIKPWGTTHAVLCGADLLTDSFAVVNADDFYGRDAYMKVAEFLRNAKPEDDFCMLGYRIENTLTDNGSVARGICQMKDGKLDTIVERTKIYKTEACARFEEDDGTSVDLEPGTVVSMNFWGFTPSVLKGLGKHFEEFVKDTDKEPLKSEALLPNFIGKMIVNNECDVTVLETSAKWFGVTYAADKPDTIARINQLIAEGEYPDGLWN